MGKDVTVEFIKEDKELELTKENFNWLVGICWDMQNKIWQLDERLDGVISELSNK